MKASNQSKTGGFTLVELLVVMACIALLAAMLLPALAKTNSRATTDVCLTNQKQFAAAWMMFSAEHNDYIVSAGQNYNISDSVFSWRLEPAFLPSYPTLLPGQAAQKVYDDYGFQLGGLYPYIKNFDLIHCPADFRYLGTAPAWCSYSMVDNMNGQTTFGGTDYRIHKSSQVKHPSGRMVLNEENDLRAESANGFSVYENIGTWEPYKPGPGGDEPNPRANPSLIGGMVNGGTPGWYDGPAAFHPNSATFSMCDGHAEVRKWSGPATIQFANSTLVAKYSAPYSGAGSLQNALDKADVYYVYSHIATPLWP